MPVQLTNSPGGATTTGQQQQAPNPPEFSGVGERREPPGTSVCPPDAPAEQSLTREQADIALAALARALGHPARVSILRTLIGMRKCIASDLASGLPLAASTVSQHLKILKEAGLIKGEVDGPRRCYCVDSSKLAWLRRLLGDLSEAGPAPPQTDESQ